MKESILVVDDEEDIVELLRYNLTKNGYKITSVGSGEDGLKAVDADRPDLILLDLMLPGVDGLDVCRRLKNDPKTQDILIIMLSAKGDEADIVSGLELGADDYLTKPFSPRVLLARIKTVLRRRRNQIPDKNSPLKVEELSIDPLRHEVRIGHELLDLTKTEFRILHFLIRQPGWVFTRYQIVEAVHGDDYPVTERSIDVQVVGLRKKLSNYGKLIETVRGVGYRFKG